MIRPATQDKLLDFIEIFLKVCQGRDLKDHGKNTELQLHEAKFCGRLISADGV